MAAAAVMLPCQGQTEAQPADSVRMYEIQQIEVRATRARQQTPVAYTDIGGEQISSMNSGQDIPYLLQSTLSLVATSESGNGIGATSLRLRGTDATRINVTMNGVPMNDAETHSVYWYDTPDIASSVGSVQIQRGAGTSTNGTGAFGGAINMTSSAMPTDFRGSASLSYGSYNTNKQAVSVSSGLMGGHWAVDARLSHVGSDGYVDRASTELLSYMVQAGYYNGRTMVKALSFGGKARVYLSYSGIYADQLATDRRYNPEGEIYGYLHDAAGNVILDGDGNPERGVVGFYKDHTDNYLQLNNQIIVNHILNERWSLNVTGHYTYGYGYYQNWKNDEELAEYGFAPVDAGGIQVAETSLIRKKSMRNDFGGIVASANYTGKKAALSVGLAANIYNGVHYGEIFSLEKAPDFAKSEYYRNHTTKIDANIFAKVDWEITRGLNLFADVQYRYVKHRINGVNDNFDWTLGRLQPLAVDRTYDDFINPKIGLSWTFRKAHNLYGSFAMAHKEPTRNNFTDIQGTDYPTSEKLLDGELGYRYSGKIIDAGINLYYMHYRDQLVLTGELSDTGEALSRNVPVSYRRGVEMTLAVRPAKWFTFAANATLSQNRIRDYIDTIDGVAFERGTTTISYSPSVIAGTTFDFHVKGFQALLRTRYVSKQYLTNGQYEDLSLSRYCVSDLDLSYTLSTRRIEKVRFGFTLFNLFNTEYCSNAYGGSWLEGATLADRKSWLCYFPQATLNMLGNVTVNF